MARPLWKTLLDLTVDGDTQLSCEDCYSLLDQYTDLLMDGADPGEVLPFVKQHLSHCPNCEEQFEALLTMVKGSEENAA